MSFCKTGMLDPCNIIYKKRFFERLQCGIALFYVILIKCNLATVQYL